MIHYIYHIQTPREDPQDAEIFGKSTFQAVVDGTPPGDFDSGRFAYNHLDDLEYWGELDLENTRDGVWEDKDRAVRITYVGQVEV